MSVSRITEIPWDSNIDLQINLANESAAPFCRSATEDVDHYRLFLTWKTRESISWRKGISGLCRGELKGSTRNEGSHWNQKWMSRIHRWVRKKEKRKKEKWKRRRKRKIYIPSFEKPSLFQVLFSSQRRFNLEERKFTDRKETCTKNAERNELEWQDWRELRTNRASWNCRRIAADRRKRPRWIHRIK